MDSKIRELSARNCVFILDMCKQPVLVAKKNLLLSPYSIDTAMSMVYAGARNETAAEMKIVMKLNAEPDDSDHHATYQLLFNCLKNKVGAGISLHSANRLYIQDDCLPEPQFLHVMQQYYDSSMDIVDFKNEPETTRKAINKWVEETTQQKIIDLLPSGAIDEMTELVLVNALYLKGNWDKKFNHEFTRKADFHVDATTTVQVDMMFQKDDFATCYNKELDCKALELPYVNKNLRMLILLPQELDGVDAMASKLSHSVLENLISSMTMQGIMVFLPKFKLECEMSLGTTFSQMGMPSLFTEGQADLSGMCSSKKLHVCLVIHKTFVEINEEGTEAAAATAVTVAGYSMPPSFNVDHPFLFLIQEKSSGMILFLGKVKDPSSM